ncbi:MAG: energy-coupling factor ABC transporter ATP-binding protein [Chloroflexi bacterium]|nr:energy-coupling factor ABC transporter ATP-binding protein [Chloroflexota bacterium]MBU1746153.1 energy-coupling factor ABC transporter ATP-binding protein [Chloroflexota bacterium]
MPDPILRAQGLGYGYPQHGRGLRAVDFAARPGEVWAVTGPSGCGKSTLARCLVGLIPHLYRGTMHGAVWVDGRRTDQAPLWQLADRAGLVFQNPAAQLLATSVRAEVLFGLENLGLPRAEMSARLDEALARFGLTHLARRDPRTLSGGEMQRLTLACISARRPAALVLDEPLSMLDTTAATAFVGYLGEQARAGASVVACEHRARYLDALPETRQFPLGDAVVVSDDSRDLPLPPAAGAGDVRLYDVTVAFGPRRVLDRLTLTLRAGQVTALVGGNGVGKTTLLRALVGLQPYRGTITADGEAPDLGLAFQNPDWQIFNPTVRDEIRYRVPHLDEALYRWLLAALGLEPYEAVPPLLLSEGEKKRLVLASVLMRRPRHGILLDEPTLGQDDAHRNTLGRALRALAGTGHVVLAATHDLAWAARWADRLVLLAPGGIVADGAPAGVLRDVGAWALAGLVVPPWVLGDHAP